MLKMKHFFSPCFFPPSLPYTHTALHAEAPGIERYELCIIIHQNNVLGYETSIGLEVCL